MIKKKKIETVTNSLPTKKKKKKKGKKKEKRKAHYQMGLVQNSIRPSKKT